MKTQYINVLMVSTSHMKGKTGNLACDEATEDRLDSCTKMREGQDRVCPSAPLISAIALFLILLTSHGLARNILVFGLILSPFFVLMHAWIKAGGRIRLICRSPEGGATRYIFPRFEVARPRTGWSRPEGPVNVSATGGSRGEDENIRGRGAPNLSKAEVMAICSEIIYKKVEKDEHGDVSPSESGKDHIIKKKSCCSETDGLDCENPRNTSAGHTCSLRTEEKSEYKEDMEASCQEKYLQHGKPFTSDATCCSICLDDFCEAERILLLPECQHIFHTDCILPWLIEKSPTCPMCKRDVRAEV